MLKTVSALEFTVRFLAGPRLWTQWDGRRERPRRWEVGGQVRMCLRLGAAQAPPGRNWVRPSWPLPPALHCHPHSPGAEGGGERLSHCSEGTAGLVRERTPNRTIEASERLRRCSDAPFSHFPPLPSSSLVTEPARSPQGCVVLAQGRLWAASHGALGSRGRLDRRC